MSRKNESPCAGEKAQGAGDTALAQKNHSPGMAELQARFGRVIDVIGELAERPIWLPHTDNKIPHDGRTRLSTAEPAHSMSLLDAINTAAENGLAGVGINMTGGILKKDDKRLMVIDIDKADFECFKRPFVGFAEISMSGNGLHLFAWVPAAFADQHQDAGKAKISDCDHAEIYFGHAARFIAMPSLTDLGHIFDSRPIPDLTHDELQHVKGWLCPVETRAATMAELPSVPGTPLDLTRFELTPEQHNLVDGKGGIDRSATWYGLFIKLLDAGVSRKDILATVAETPALLSAFADHRHGDLEKAIDFARQEIEKAFLKSRAGMCERLTGFCDQWKTSADNPVAKLDAPQSAPPSRRKPISQLLAEIKPYTWLLEGVLPLGHFIALLGPPNSGKTAVALDLALHIALDRKLGPRRIQPTRVIYVAAENPEEVKLRIQLWCDKYDVPPTDLDDLFYLVEASVFFDQETQAGAFHDEWADTAPGLVVIDTFSANYSGESENSATEVMRWFNNIRKYLIQPFGCAVMVLHHPPKNSDNPFEWRGSGGAIATLDSTWAAVNGGGTITLMQGKHRSPTFEDLYWKCHIGQVKGQVDNFGNPTMSVIATPTGKSLEVGRNQGLVKICAAIDAGITTHRGLAELSGIYRSGISKTLEGMKTSDDDHGKLLRERNGALYLTAEGKEWAAEGRILLAGKLSAPTQKGGEI